MRLQTALIIAALALPTLTAGSCSHNPGARVEIRTVEVVREVPRDCPGERPTRPEDFAPPLGISWERLAKLATAKLAEFSGEGQYADQAEAIFDRCPLSGAEPSESP